MAGLGALNGLIVGRALGRSGRESDGEFRTAANLVAGALLAETAELERGPAPNPAAAADLDQVRQAAPSSAYLRLLERVARRLGSLPADDLDARHAGSTSRNWWRGCGRTCSGWHGIRSSRRSCGAGRRWRRSCSGRNSSARRNESERPPTPVRRRRATLGAIERELRGGAGKES